jgi:hypothetical protein
MEDLTPLSQRMDSGSNVQEIDPTVLIRSGCKKRSIRILLHPLDRRFCRCNKRNKKTEQEIAGIPNATVPPQTSLGADSTSVQEYADAIR